MFKFPQVIQKRPQPKDTHKFFNGIPCFNYNDVKKENLIGAGSYGKVFKAKYDSKDVVLKELDDIEERDLIKEAKFHKELSHPNVVKFFAICKEPKALMLEYVFFNMTPFGRHVEVSSLDSLLLELDKIHFAGFEHLVPKIAKGIVAGLHFLHKKGVAHRDLKPGNILVSNKHLEDCKTQEEQELMWKDNPCVIKLTDFGESWGTICQTAAAAKSHTVNVYKGTPAFMAPEVLDPAKRPMEMKVEQLKLAGMWSLSMVFFCLVNPNLKVPFFKEARETGNVRKWQNFLVEKVSSGSLPSGEDSYDHLKATEWIQIDEAFRHGVQKEAVKRPSLQDIDRILRKTSDSSSYPLAIHQGTALETAYPFGEEGNFQEPENDGTNACAFLACKFSEIILKNDFTDWQNLANDVEQIVKVFPVSVNKVRDKGMNYDIPTAYELMHKSGLISKLKFAEKGHGHLVFSDAGRKDLLQFVGRMGKAAVMTVPPYTFLIGRKHQDYYIIDSHSIGPECDGNGMGILKVFEDTETMGRWLWRRLHISGIVNERQQIFEVEIPCREKDKEDLIMIEDSLEEKDMRADTSSGSAEDLMNVDSISPMKPLSITSSDKGTEETVEVTKSCWRTDFSNPDNWKKSEQSKWGPYGLPYISTQGSKLKFSEQLAVIKAHLPKATRIPQGCRRNAIFIIDSQHVKHLNDIQSDLNGVFKKCLEIKRYVVDVSRNATGSQNMKVHREKKELGPEQLYLQVNRKQNTFGLTRDISYLLDNEGRVFENSVILQYIVDKNICGNVEEIKYKVPQHGNAKGIESGSFHPLKKSTLKRLREETCSQVMMKHDQFEAGEDFGDKPRSKKQLSDIMRYSPQRMHESPENEVESILAYDEELQEDRIVWSHSDIPEDLWVLGTKRMLNDLSHAEGGQPISIDPTFNHGKFEVTPITYRHQFILSKSKNVAGQWNNAIMLGPTLIHHGKSDETYDRALKEICRKTKLATKKIGIVTDGEQALINACKANLPKSVRMRCTKHFRENCQDYLRVIGIKSDISQAPFLEVVFGEDGLVESTDKIDLEQKLKEKSKIIDEMEAEILGKAERKFSTFLQKREKTVLRQMIQGRRQKGGMPTGANGVPYRVYTNQSESINSMLAAKKQSLGFSKKEDLSKAQFICKVWEAVVSEQNQEIERALYGQSECFRLADEADYLKVEVEEWYNWNPMKRKR